jgi:hypothetical protein
MVAAQAQQQLYTHAAEPKAVQERRPKVGQGIAEQCTAAANQTGIHARMGYCIAAACASWVVLDVGRTISQLHIC